MIIKFYNSTSTNNVDIPSNLFKYLFGNIKLTKKYYCIDKYKNERASSHFIEFQFKYKYISILLSISFKDEFEFGFEFKKNNCKILAKEIIKFAINKKTNFTNIVNFLENKLKHKNQKELINMITLEIYYKNKLKMHFYSYLN